MKTDIVVPYGSINKCFVFNVILICFCFVPRPTQFIVKGGREKLSFQQKGGVVQKSLGTPAL